MKRVMAVLLCAGFALNTFATKSRILSMGKHDAFFMDEVSVFRNPSNVSIYPNLLMGSYGEYRYSPSADTSQYEALQRRNSDPTDPFFGAILSYSLKQSSEAGNQYPMVSVGAVFNRKDPLLQYATPDTNLYGSGVAGADIAEPIGKADVLLGYAFPNGGMIGVGTYLAWQKLTEGSSTLNETSLYKGTVGLNWPIARSMDLEASVGVSSLTAESGDTVLASDDISVEADLRLFSALTALNGDFVPHVGFKRISLEDNETSLLEVAGGLGLNINIDKGFFWAGIEGLYEQKDRDLNNLQDSTAIGGRVSFGIERNVVWDWFVVRVGGQKEIMYTTANVDDGGWVENPETDSDDDLVGLGIGLNVENRLKFDILVAEDVQNTLTNLLSGPMHHVFTRIDATFSF